MRFQAGSRIQPFPGPLRLLACLSLWLASGCSSPSPIDPVTIADPRLCAIQDCLQACVAEADADSSRRWCHGWFGNSFVLLFPDQFRGLCYQWQDEVYTAVRPVAARIGWRAARIEINPDALVEHHAVIVYDPALTNESSLLTDSPAHAAFVLDPWHRGRPDLFELHDWLKQFNHTGGPALLE